VGDLIQDAADAVLQLLVLVIGHDGILVSLGAGISDAFDVPGL
jgi:hypothetical protein